MTDNQESAILHFLLGFIACLVVVYLISRVEWTWFGEKLIVVIRIKIG